MNKKLFIALFIMVIITFQLIVVLQETACATSWYEMVCETGDYIPSFMRGVWGSSSTDVFFVGEGGYIFHYDGLNCHTRLDNHFADIDTLYGLWGSSPDNVF